MERVWELARLELYQLRRDHLDWSQTQLAAKLGYSLSWVKKWLRRFRQAKTMSLDVFKSQSRAAQHNPRTVQPLVRQAILGFRDALREKYHRSVGAKTILYHLHHDPWLKQQNVYLPRSSRIIWQVLKDGGRIPTRVRDHHPLERPEPMQFWEMDFGQLGDAFEFFVWIDRGTSILVDTDTQFHFNAESTLLSLANTFVTHGLPEKIRCDNDARFVGSWLRDQYPSPMMKFLLCLGVQPDLADPGKLTSSLMLNGVSAPSNTNVCGRNILKMPFTPKQSCASFRYFTTRIGLTSPIFVRTARRIKRSQNYPHLGRSQRM